MCGIIGIIAQNLDVINQTIAGLKNLEYRGYDSAGISIISNKQLLTIKASGKICNLEELLNEKPLNSNIAIAHTRWATHGSPSKDNAHPHYTDKVSIVHNGIIENYLEIKKMLELEGYNFISQTDTEVIPQLITFFLNQGHSCSISLSKALEKLEGAFSIAAIFAQNQDRIFVARKGSPLVIIYGENFNAVASDAHALSFLSNKISYLNENDIAVISQDKIEIFNNNIKVDREIHLIEDYNSFEAKGKYQHYMLKEIYEQPAIISNTIKHNLNSLSKLNIDLSHLSKINIIACGTSYYSALIAKYWLEKMIDIPIEADIASEYRYRRTKSAKKELCIFISQSGETADTLASLRHAKSFGHIVISIINVKESSLDRESDFSFYCYAGPEISVASTKGFTSQLTVLLLFFANFCLQNNYINKEKFQDILSIVHSIPGHLAQALNCENQIKAIAENIAGFNRILFIGRNYMYPVALEGALKLKELSYIHAEAIAAGELKHGPIALVDSQTQIIALAPENFLFEKTFSNIQEIAARGGQITSFSTAEGNKILKNLTKHQLNISTAHELIDPIIYAVPMQLLAYHVAIFLKRDVDQPRNLAKSVTVE